MQLALFKQSLSKKVYCSDDLESGLMIRNVGHALTKKYIQHNHKNSQLWLSFDIDRPTCVDEITDDRALPAPTLLIQNKRNGHGHALYALETAIHLNLNSSNKAIRFAAAVDTAFSKKIDADPNYVGLITKNPLHEEWQTYATGGTYDLTELSDYVDLQSDRRRALPSVGLGRNCNIFDSVRRAAYRAIESCRSQGYQAWCSHVVNITSSHNDQLVAPLRASEVMSISKSVAHWVWKNYTGKGDSRGRDAAQGIQLNLQEKQALSAAITNRQQVDSTRAAIKVALARLDAAGKKATQKAVAEMTGRALKTVKRHWDLKT